jgi:hypothetical protein
MVDRQDIVSIFDFASETGRIWQFRQEFRLSSCFHEQYLSPAFPAFRGAFTKRHTESKFAAIP